VNTSLTAAISGLIAGSLASAVLAAEAGAPSAGAEAGLEEVIVTAEKREESASRTPIALSVLTGEELKDRGVVSVSQLTDVAPSVIVGRDSFGVNVNIRGVTTTDQTSKGEQGIAFNIDGITIGRPMEQGAALFDVARIEVLRGPQGTLYGKSTTGGAVNVITNRPGKEFAAVANVEFGNYDTVRGDAVINLPVTDVVALRFAGSANRRDGFLNPSDGSTSRNDQHDTSGRASVLLDFGGTTLYAAATVGSIGGVGFATVPLANVQGHSGSSQRVVFGNPFTAKLDDHYANFNAELNADLGPVRLTYVGAHLQYSPDEQTSGTQDPAANGDQYAWGHYTGDWKTDSHELRLSNANEGALTWVFGANWNKENIHEDDHRFTAPVATPTIAASLNGIDPLNNTVHTSKGVFSQATYAFSSAFHLTAGLRWSDDSVERRGTFAPGPGPWPNAAGQPCTGGAVITPCIGFPNNGDQSASKVTYRLGAEWFLAPQQMLYAYVASGYKAGGFNDFDLVLGPATGPVPYEPEELIAYEVGYKGRPLSNLEWNSSVYYYDYKKMQISSLVNVSGAFVLATQTVPTKIYGWENELKWRISRSDRINATLTTAKSKYVRYLAGLNRDVDWSGDSLDKTPSFTASLGWQHDWTLGNGGTLSGYVGSRYSSSYDVSDFVGAVHVNQDSFTRSDLRLTYTDASQKYFIQLFARNLEDKVQIVSLGDSGTAAVSEPRFFGVRTGVKL